jgi:hypothetical protein
MRSNNTRWTILRMCNQMRTKSSIQVPKEMNSQCGVAHGEQTSKYATKWKLNVSLNSQKMELALGNN